METKEKSMHGYRELDLGVYGDEQEGFHEKSRA
jgi:hypothetical protein